MVVRLSALRTGRALLPTSYYLSKFNLNIILPPTSWSFIKRIRLSSRLMYVFRNRLIFNGEVLTPRPFPKLKDHPLSFVRDCLFNIFVPNLHIWRRFLHPQPEDAPCCGLKDPLNMLNLAVNYLNSMRMKLRNLTQ
jgi:hypothetical protein